MKHTPPDSPAKTLNALELHGYSLLQNVFAERDVAQIIDEVSSALAGGGDDGPLRSQSGALYGARNVAELWPDVVNAWRRPVLEDALEAVLGPTFGLVRVLYFDKPPEQSWSLPWHRDLTIAVANNKLPSEQFKRPTTKAGVPHVEAPPAVLTRMVTARIHLDEITAENGPLCVLPGSHRIDETPEIGTLATNQGSSVPVLSAAGDVLLMRPLLAHCSGHSQPGTKLHRRILHLEFAADERLPDGYAWRTFARNSGN